MTTREIRVSFSIGDLTGELWDNYSPESEKYDHVCMTLPQTAKMWKKWKKETRKAADYRMQEIVNKYFPNMLFEFSENYDGWVSYDVTLEL